MRNLLKVAQSVAEFINAGDYGVEATAGVVQKNNYSYNTVTIKNIDSNIGCNVNIDKIDGVESLSIEDIAEKVLVVAEENALEAIDADVLTSWDYIKDRVYPCLVNASNKEFLKDMVSYTVCDLAVYFRCPVEIGLSDGISSFAITKGHLKALGKTVEDIKAAAISNAEGEASVKSMFETLGNLLDLDDSFVDSMVPSEPMYVISNNTMVHGAGTIINNNVMDKVCDIFKSDKLCIIPSSIHECIVVNLGLVSLDTVADMIKEVNATQVAVSDQLSDHPYVYIKGVGLTSNVTSAAA